MMPSHSYEFKPQHALRESRAIDDKIIQALNNSIPTASFKGKVDSANKCKDLWRTVCSFRGCPESVSHCNDTRCVPQIESTYSTRAGAINRCIASTESRIEAVRAGGGEVKRQDRTAVCPNDVTCS